ncbi:MAG: glycosyltransferase family 2 protein [Ruminococcaceae bacterium]|nr:glycosyltransferase family 2 protein [Oscillospiraceae bacterium]
MSKLQVLLATRNQQDFSIAEQMNISCDAIIANQAEQDCFAQLQSSAGEWKMITTSTRGVGLNRNIALLAATGEFVLFADDDVVYNDGMPEAVIAAFRENPKADVIIFGMDIVKNGEVTERRHLQSKRLRVTNAMRFGTYTIAARRQALLQHNITFHQMFGGGCPFGSGEDSLFLKACFDHKLQVYSHTYVLGTCRKDTSTWFTGYHEKYFYDKGVLLRHLFPKAHYLAAPYFAFRFKRKTQIPAMQRLKLMLAGIRGGKKMLPYEDAL